MTSNDLRDRVTAEGSGSVLNDMWVKYKKVVDLLFTGTFYENYTVLANGSAFDDGAGYTEVDDLLFKYAINDSGFRIVNEAEWLEDIYDYILRKWLASITVPDSFLGLQNAKDPAGEDPYTDDDFDEADTDGFPGPTIDCLWDEMTDIGLDAQERRDFAYDAPTIALIDSSAYNTAAQENFMLRWYLKQLELRFEQTFVVNGDDETFTVDEQTEWEKLLVEVRDYPDWADAEHIA